MTAVIVTRPRREAQQWVQSLQEAGWAAQALPLIEIAPPDDPVALQHCRARADGCDALMFVSAQAVAAWFGDAALAAGRLPRCWAPGPGTARALRRAGVPLALIDAPRDDAPQFDSESLWAVVAPQLKAGFRLLIVRGGSQGQDSEGMGNGREWLARQCEAAGAQVAWCMAYLRRAPVWNETTRRAARGHAHDGSWWLLSSSEAVAHLATLCPGTDWAQARALVTHPRIAQAAQALGFGTIITTRPALADVLQCLSSQS